MIVSLYLLGGAMLAFSHFKTASLLFTSLLLLTACSSKKSDLRHKQASLYFGAGTQSLMDKQYTEALRNLLEANKLEPENSEILNNLGMAYYFKGERDEAVRHLNLALKYNPENSDARVNLASIFYKDGKIHESEQIYKVVTRDLTYDKQARTYFNLGIIELHNKQDMVAAENYFKKSIKEDDNYCPSYHHLGLIQFNRRQFNTALRNFKEATMGPCYDFPAPHYYQAMTLIELRKYDDARIKLDEIETRFKKSTFALKARAKVIELNQMNKNKSIESHASRKVLESPDF
jgi:type IV pilus assembly protein PilF